MSKLIDKLDETERIAPARLGFGTGSTREKPAPSILLIGRILPDQLARDKALSEVAVDAFLVDVGEWRDGAVDGVAAALGEHLWGVQVKGLGPQQVEELAESGCDFVVFDAAGAPAAILSAEDLGKVITIGPDLSEELARAVHDLPIDAILYTPQGEFRPRTVQDLIDLQAVRGLVEKLFVMASPLPLGKEELEALRGSNVAGLVVDASSPEAVSATSEAIRALPKRKARPGRADALVPRVAAGFGEDQHVHEDEEEEEEFRFS